MIKNNKLKLIISSLLILLPTLFGLIIWDKLPNEMVTHIGLDGAADGFSRKIFAVFIMPAILLLLHWLCLFITAKDPKNQNQTKKASGMVYWIIPGISIYVSLMIYSLALGLELSYEVLTLVFLGLMFIMLGNYMPKCKQNYSLGIKVKWALENEENWYATHRFGGKVWVVTGIALMLCALLPTRFIPAILIACLIPAAALPVAYSYAYYKKQQKDGTYEVTAIRPPMPKSYKIFSLIVIGAAAVLLPIIMFTGDINIVYSEDSFTLEADYYDDIKVGYENITHIEYREEAVSGLRTNGYASARLLMGLFENEELGYYTRYTYSKDTGCVILKIGEEELVLGGKTEEATKEIFNKLSEKMSR